MDLEEGKVTGVDDVSLTGMRMQPRFDSKDLAEIFAPSSQGRSDPTGTGVSPPPAPPLYQEALKRAEAVHEDEQNAKTGAQQQEKQQDADATGDEGASSSLPTSKLAAMSLATAHQGGKLSEAAPKLVPGQRSNRPQRRRLSAPSA